MEGNETDKAITYAADFIIFYKDNTFEIVGYERLRISSMGAHLQNV